MNHGGYRKPLPRSEKEFFHEHYPSTETDQFRKMFADRFGYELTRFQAQNRANNWRIRKEPALTTRRSPLSADERRFFRERYPARSNKEFAAEYQKRYGRKISVKSVQNTAHKMKLEKSIPDGWVATKEAAELLGVDMDSFHRHRRKAGVAPTRFGVLSAITIDQLDQIEYHLDKVDFYGKQKRKKANNVSK